MLEIDTEKLLKALTGILGRGNVAEIRKTKDGVMVFEVKRKQVK